jgi:hypothetical protein
MARTGTKNCPQRHTCASCQDESSPDERSTSVRLTVVVAVEHVKEVGEQEVQDVLALAVHSAALPGHQVGLQRMQKTRAHNFQRVWQGPDSAATRALVEGGAIPRQQNPGKAQSQQHTLCADQKNRNGGQAASENPHHALGEGLAPHQTVLILQHRTTKTVSTAANASRHDGWHAQFRRKHER